MTSPAAISLDISSQVDRSEITIGDRIKYEIKVVFPAGGRLELPSVLGNLGAFEVKEYQASEPKPADGLEIQTWHFNLSTFTVGKYTIPPQQIIYRQGQDTTATIHFTQPIEINVIRTSAETVKDIADIASLAAVKSSPPWLAYGLGFAVLLAIAFFLLRRFRPKTPATKIAPVLPPFEEAMAKLATIKDLALVRQNKPKEFCFILSETLRKYVSRRYRIDALESTTSEFIEKARNLPVTGAQKLWLAEFSTSTDLIKFANAPLAESEAAKLLAKVEEFLQHTKPTPAEIAAQVTAEATDAQESAASGFAASSALSASKASKTVKASAATSTSATFAASQLAKGSPSTPPKPQPPIKPKGVNKGPGYTQGGHGHDGDSSREWVG